MPDTVSALESLDLLDELRKTATPMNAIRVFSPSHRSFAIPANCLTLSRKHYDNFLANAAARSGAVFVQGHVKDLRQTDTAVEVTLSERADPIRCRICVLATGASVRLSEHLGLIDRVRASAIALRGYVRSSYAISEAIIAYERHLLPGYAWIVPIGSDIYNVGCGVRLDSDGGSTPNLKKALDVFLDSFPLGRDLMSKGEKISPVSGAALRCNLDGNRELTRGRVVAVGECIGTTYLFSGEGIGKAMQTAMIAADRIVAALERDDPGELQSYAEQVTGELKPRYHVYAEAEKWLARPWLNDFMTRRIASSPYLQKRVRDVVNETADPSVVFSPLSILRSYFR
jgi:flavin-dependent dehydrogenase